METPIPGSPGYSLVRHRLPEGRPVRVACEVYTPQHFFILFGFGGYSAIGTKSGVGRSRSGGVNFGQQGSRSEITSEEWIELFAIIGHASLDEAYFLTDMLLNDTRTSRTSGIKQRNRYFEVAIEMLWGTFERGAVSRRAFFSQTATLAVSGSAVGLIRAWRAQLLRVRPSLSWNDEESISMPYLESCHLAGRTSRGALVPATSLGKNGCIEPVNSHPNSRPCPRSPVLPEPNLASPEGWRHERQQIRALFEQWVYGRMPPPPENLRAVVTGTHREGGTTVRDVRLEFGPEHRATLRVQLLIPPGEGPFPVFLTNHGRKRPWVATAVRRGYIGCIYFATDPIYGNGDDSDAYIDIYQDYDFSCLARWAWAGMRAVDYLCTLPEVEKTQIAMSGHSRNGKQALLAAFDERIGAVIPSSGNSGEDDPWRYTSDMFVNESLEETTGGFPNWFHPRFRFFSGREDKLPVDQNLLMALVAPRGLFMYSAFSEAEGGPFGFEQAYRSALKVYKHFGAEDNLWLNLREGEHHHGGRYRDLPGLPRLGIRPEALPQTRNMDQRVHVRKLAKGLLRVARPDAAPKADAWRLCQRPVGRKKSAIRRQIEWALGEEPAGITFPAAHTIDEKVYTSDGWLSLLFGRPLKAPGMASAQVAFGDDLKADLYYPDYEDLNHPIEGYSLPLVLWLHPFSYATGYSAGGVSIIHSLVSQGFVVLAFDQIGFGTRVRSAREFYDRYRTGA